MKTTFIALHFTFPFFLNSKTQSHFHQNKKWKKQIEIVLFTYFTTTLYEQHIISCTIFFLQLLRSVYKQTNKGNLETQQVLNENPNLVTCIFHKKGKHVLNQISEPSFMNTSISMSANFFFFLLPAQVSELSITGRDQTGYTVHAGFCMFPQSCDLRTEIAGSL
jgi:hypothetical protein